ncbi:MAG TPA: VOC family protein [Bradyrhizobium sp.]|nr:VOC family protein [Bradyrhizobium sp.]
MVDDPTAFAWYELLTTDLPAAQSFYGKVVGWSVQDASTPQFAYRLFSTGGAPVAGLMELPPEGRKKGATPRWVGYVAVRDVGESVDRLKALGGAVYVPPTDSNIGRIAVVADPQTATLALVSGLKYGAPAAEAGEPGRVGWHELLAGEGKAAFGFYGALFGWEKGRAEDALVDSYELFASGGRTLGGMFTKFAATPVPFWLYYFEVADLDAAIDQVKAGGGRVAQGPIELWGGNWAARCIDPQGAMFALQGRRPKSAIGRSGEGHGDAALAFSTSWGGISSRGQLLGNKPSKKPKGKNRS